MSDPPPKILGRELTAAVRSGNPDEILRLWEEHGVLLDVDYKGGYDLTALSWAAALGHHDSCRVLVGTCGADINCVDHFRFTPLIAAVRQGHFKCVDVLLELGADVSPREENGLNALDIARQKGDLAIVSRLEPMVKSAAKT